MASKRTAQIEPVVIDSVQGEYRAAGIISESELRELERDHEAGTSGRR